MLSLLLGSTLALAPVQTEQPPPRFRGIGMFVGAAAFGIAGFGFKMIGTVNDPAEARAIERGESPCFDFCYVGTIFNATSAPFWVSSLGLLGGGMHMRARWLAYWDVEDGIDRTRRARVSLGTGAGLLGAGVVAFTVLQAARLGTDHQPTGIVLRESAWWTGLALGYAGATLAGWGNGYLRGREDRMVHVIPHPRGFAIAGRF